MTKKVALISESAFSEAERLLPCLDIENCKCVDDVVELGVFILQRAKGHEIRFFDLEKGKLQAILKPFKTTV